MPQKITPPGPCGMSGGEQFPDNDIGSSVNGSIRNPPTNCGPEDRSIIVYGLQHLRHIALNYLKFCRRLDGLVGAASHRPPTTPKAGSILSAFSPPALGEGGHCGVAGRGIAVGRRAVLVVPETATGSLREPRWP
jgi:hypothetical protein